MANEIKFPTLQSKGLSRRRSGFSLIELLCVVAIMGCLLAVSTISATTTAPARLLSSNIYELAELIREARIAATTQNTYVAIGFYPYSKDGNSMLRIATVYAKSGLLSDLKNGNFQLLSKTVVLSNVQFQNSSYLSLSGVDVSNNMDISQSDYSFQMTVPGNATAVTFSRVIVIYPNGEMSLKQDAITRCLGVGLDATPLSSQKQRLAAVQVAGLSGQVSVFEQ